MEKTKSKIKRVAPAIIVEGNAYKVCSLNFNMRDQEFIYHFALPRDAESKLWNYTSQKKTGRPDHITFHKNGRVHLSLKGDKKKLGIGNAPDASFLPVDPDTITPLLVHSLYPIDGKYYLPLSDEAGPRNVWTKSGAFSVIIFLTPAKFKRDEFLNTIWLNTDKGKIFGSLLGAPAGRIEVWDGWVIDYVLSDLTLPLPTQKELIPCHSAFAYKDLHLVFKTLLAQRCANIEKLCVERRRRILKCGVLAILGLLLFF